MIILRAPFFIFRSIRSIVRNNIDYRERMTQTRVVYVKKYSVLRLSCCNERALNSRLCELRIDFLIEDG